MVGGEDQVGVLQGPGFAPGVQDPADLGVEDLLQVALLLVEGGVGYVGEEVDTREVEGLDVGDARVADFFEDRIDRLLVELPVDGHRAGLVVPVEGAGQEDREDLGQVGAPRQREDVRAAVEVRQGHVGAEVGLLVEGGHLHVPAHRAVVHGVHHLAHVGHGHRCRGEKDRAVLAVADELLVAGDAGVRRPLAGEDGRPAGDGGRREDAEDLRVRKGVGEAPVVLQTQGLGELGHVARPHRLDQRLVAYAVEAEEDHPGRAPDGPPLVGQVRLVTLDEGLGRLDRLVGVEAGEAHRGREEQPRAGEMGGAHSRLVGSFSNSVTSMGVISR